MSSRARDAGRWLRFGARLAAAVLMVGLVGTAGVAAAAAETLGSEESVETEATDGRSHEGTVEEKKSRLEKLEEQIKILAEEIADLQTEEAVPMSWDPTDGFNGLGPGASKVYTKKRGLSLGGYGDVRFRHKLDENDGSASVYDTLRFVLYTGYKFNDWLVFNSELEVEHADTGSDGSVAVEFLTLDFLARDWINFRTGLVLIPMGFINEVHEPPFYFGAERPEVERRIIPSTWRENGMGIFGGWDFGQAGALSYRMYAVNGFDGSGFDSKGLRGGRQKGSQALADHWAFVGRVDYDMGGFLPGASLGGSVYTGKSGQKQSNTVCTDFCTTAPGDPVIEPITESRKLPDALTTLYEVHAQYRGHGVTVRGLFSHAFVDDAGDLSFALGKSAGSSVAKEMLGGYAEVAYDVLPLFIEDTKMSLEPFYRFEHVDTQHEVASGYVKDKSRRFDLHVVGVNFKPIPQVVLKLDYRDFEADEGSISDEVQFSVGFVF